MTKQNKNRKGQATLEEMVKSCSQIVLMHDDGSEQPIEEIIEANHPSQDDQYANEFHYKSWWNQFRGTWLQSKKMTGYEIKTRAVRYETGITLKRIHFDEVHKGVALQPLNKDFKIEFIDADQSQ